MQVGRAVRALILGAASAGVAYGAGSLQLFDTTVGRIEQQTVDYRMRAADRTSADSSRVVLVLFDSATVQEWPYLVPFPRLALARIVDAVAASGASVIGLDVYLERPYPPLNAMDGGDDALRRAIADAGNVVLVAPMEGADTARTLVPPDPFFAEGAAAVASADLPTPFEVVTAVAMVTATNEGLVPGFALALWAHATGTPLEQLLADAQRSGRLDIEPLPAEYRALPDDGAHVVPVYFEGPPSRAGREDGAFRAFEANTVMTMAAFAPDVLRSWFEDRVVVLGSGFHDSERFRTPYYEARREDGELAGWTYGVEVHATAVDNLLRGHLPAPLGAPARAGLLLAVALLVSGATFRGGVKWGGVLAAASVAAVWAAALVAFWETRTVVPMVTPALAAVFAFLSSTSWVSIVEGREKRRIRGAFSKYVPPDIVAELVEHPERLKLGGEKREITILFSDLAGFTTLSERLEPDVLVALLNEYLEAMSEVVFLEGGTLDKYIGDAVMAFWGAPRAQQDHALRACRAALAMQHRLDELNAMWRERDPEWPLLRMRVGINSGEPVVGNIGGEQRFNYTTLGDAVNLAARLEPACKIYGVYTMIGEPTRAAAGDAIQVRELDVLAVYGKEEPVRVYELLGLAGVDLGHRSEAIALYEQGLETFRNRDFELAARYFEAALQVDENDGAAALYLERCREFMLNPPPADWDFVERRRIK